MYTPQKEMTPEQLNFEYNDQQLNVEYQQLNVEYQQLNVEYQQLN